MKKIFCLFFFLIITTLFNGDTSAQVFTDWQWKHPTPQGNTLRWIKAWDANNWYAVGYAGTFMKTSNAGANWYFHHKAGYPASDGSTGNLYCANFINQNTGIVAGSGGAVLRTTNAGVTFDTVTSLSSSGTIYFFYFINNNTGFLAGSSTIRLYSTTNGGLNWTSVNTPTTSMTVYDVYATDMNNIKICSSTGYFYYTTNGGSSWTTISTGTSESLNAMEFVNPNTGFVTGSGGTFRYTTNGGLNWTTANTPVFNSMYNLFYTAQSIHSVKYYQGFDSAGFPPLFWRQVSVMGSNTWEKNTTFYISPPASAFINYQGSGLGEDWLISNLLPVSSVDSLIFYVRKQFTSPFPPDSLIVRISTDTALASFTNVLKRIDVANLPANTWVRQSSPLNSIAGQSVYFAFQHKDNNGNGMYLDSIIITTPGNYPNEIYTIGDATNLYKTSNLGVNWTAVQWTDPLQNVTATSYAMDINGINMFVVGGNGLINWSTNNGSNWASSTTLKYNGTLYDAFAETNNGKVWVVGSPSISQDQIIFSSNGGITWINQPSNSNATFRSIRMVNSNTGFVCGTSGIIRKTTNGGTSWDSLPFPITSITLYRIDFVNITTGFVFGSSGNVWATSNAGSTWIQLQTGITNTLETGDFTDASTGWLTGATGTIYKTTNSGLNWTQQNANTTGTIYELRMVNSNTGYLCGSSGTLRRTTNSGANWDTINSPVTNSLFGMHVIDASNLLIGSTNGTIGYSSNGGQSWSIQNTGGSTVNGLYMVSADSGWAAQALGYIHKLSKNITPISTWENSIPEEFKLSQNYPNPFNPTTTIEFGLPKQAKVTMKIYDITGREVQTIFDEFAFNAGTIKQKFDGTNLASGIYFYSLIVDGNLFDTKKMVIVK